MSSGTELHYGERVRLKSATVAHCLTYGARGANPVSKAALARGQEFTVCSKLRKLPAVPLMGELTVLVRDDVGTWCLPARLLEVVTASAPAAAG
jgi:hypothetical protein